MKKILIILGILIIVFLLGKIIYDNRNVENNLEKLENISESTLYLDLFEVYKKDKLRYPINLDELNEYLDALNDSGLNWKRELLIDPFSNKNLIYQPIIINNKIVDFALYSIGPDTIDDNMIYFSSYNKLSDTIFFNSIYKSTKKSNYGDILVHMPQNKNIKFLFIE